MSSQPVVRWEQLDPTTLLIIFDRPPANALGLPLIEGLRDAIDVAESRDGCQIVIIASRIPGIFAAGADIKHMVDASPETFADYGAALRPQIERLATTRLTTIAAIEGLTLGGGLEIAMACTFRVAASGSSFGLPEVKLGLIPGGGGTQRLPRLVGEGRALDIMLTGRRVPSAEALEMGLISRLCADGEAEAEALALARTLTQMSSQAMGAVRRCVEASYDGSMVDGLAMEAVESMTLFTEGDAREGLSAFIEKRQPEYR